tara:strand:+ start:2746 stop:3072 length:327 start_codon:yes stop_codon:yes gene_type:complete
MKKKNNVTKIWENRKKILEGIKNNVFRNDAVEAIAEERNKICKACSNYDTEGVLCTVPGTAPCCGACGCSLKFKQRSLASGCDEGYWEPVLTEEEDMDHDILNPEIND